MAFAIKADLGEPDAETFAFTAQKTMYGGKAIAKGDLLFIFSDKHDRGLVAKAIALSAKAVPRSAGVERQTPRVSIQALRDALVKRPLLRCDLIGFSVWKDDRPQTELNFKFYRQATNKIVGISDETAAFLNDFF